MVTRSPGSSLRGWRPWTCGAGTSGVTVLIAARNHALAADAAIALAALPERLARIFRMVGLDQVFPTHPTARDAEHAWQTDSDRPTRH